MDGRDDLQLLPGTKKRLGIKVPGENRFLYIGSAILGAVIVTSFGFGRYQTSLENQIKQINDQIASLEQRRNRSEEQDLRVFRDRIRVINQILDDHIYWTKALATIESLIQSEVRFSSFSGSAESGKVNIEGKTVSYTTLAKQIASFLAGEGIEDISLGKMATSGDGGVEFQMEITFNKSKFIQKRK